MDNQPQYFLYENNDILLNQNYESGQVFEASYPDGNISVSNDLSSVNISQYCLTDNSQALNNNVTVPEFSLSDSNNIQSKPITYDTNSYLYNFQNTNYNNYPITNSINYTGNNNKLKEQILILPLYLSSYQYLTTSNPTNYLSQITSYDNQPNSILVDYGYDNNNISDINNQYITSTSALTTQVNDLSLQNGYIPNYNNSQLQDVVENYPNDFYVQNKNVNMDPYYITNSYDNNKINADSYNLTSNYNTYNLNSSKEEIISQSYQNNLNTVYNEDNSNINNLGGILSSNKHIDSAYLIKSFPISKKSPNRISLPPAVIIPNSKDEYTPIKMKRYIQKVKALSPKREKVVIPAYDNIYNFSNDNNFFITEQENNSIQTTQNVILSENNNYDLRNENVVISGNDNNYIQNTENILTSVQENNYIINTENAIIYGQESNNDLNNENAIIYGEENNVLPNIENTYNSRKDSSYPSTNENSNNIISKENNIYLHTPKIIRTTNKILPPRRSFLEKHSSFRTPIKKAFHKKYYSTGVRATSPLRYSGEASTNLVSLSPIRTVDSPLI